MIEHIEKSIKNAEQKVSNLTEDDFKLLSYGNHKHQMSSEMVKHLLNNMCSMKDCRHLAIGLYKGGSLCASLKGNFDLSVTAIDNWCHDGFDPTIKPEFDKRFKLYDNGKVKIIEKDCFKVDVSTLPKSNFYFFDGEHTEEDQYKAIVHYHNCMEDRFIFMVDDYNIKHVRTGTQRGIKDSNLKIEKDFELFSKKSGDLSSWWNGLYIAVLNK